MKRATKMIELPVLTVDLLKSEGVLPSVLGLLIGLRQFAWRVFTSQFLERIADQSPSLFSHWRVGMTGAFA